jgi:HlyD family secretion protein
MTELSKLRIDRDAEVTRSSGTIKKLVVWVVVLAVLAAAGFFLWKGPLKPARTVQTTTVRTVYPSQASSFLNASGYVVAQRKSSVASKATGRLEHLDVEEGSMVKKGQVLARLESSDVNAALASAKADLKVAEASLAQADANYKRAQKVRDQKLISEQDYDLAEADYKRGIANVESSKAKVASAQVAVENTFIRAPFNGTVLTKDADIGDMVAPFGSAGNSKGSVVSMADMDSLQVEADVSEANIERVRDGQPCEITLDAFPEKRYRGIVHMIVPTADRAKATVLVKVKFLDQDERVLPEMSAKVAFLTKEISLSESQATPKTAIDPGAVADRNGQKVVFVMNNDRVAEKPVKLGASVGDLVEVLDGVSAGTSVVLHPSDDLKNGDKVKTAE